jgi:hypothetical protein
MSFRKSLKLACSLLVGVLVVANNRTGYSLQHLVIGTVIMCWVTYGGAGLILSDRPTRRGSLAYWVLGLVLAVVYSYHQYF